MLVVAFDGADVFVAFVFVVLLVEFVGTVVLPADEVFVFDVLLV